jgi:hypothetical protein
MRNRRRKIVEEDSKTLGSQIPGLSMFVIMLAFFIVLNSVSVIKPERAKPMMEGIEQAFASKIMEREDWLPSSSPDDEKSVGGGRTIDRVERMFSAHIAGIKTQKDEGSGTLLMRIKYADFAAAVSSVGAGADANADFMRTLTSMMKSSAAGQPYRMDVFLLTGENPPALQNDQPQKMAVLMRDLGALAQTLEQAGLPQKLLTIGMEQGQEGMVELLFRPHVPYNPLGKTGEAE